MNFLTLYSGLQFPTVADATSTFVRRTIEEEIADALATHMPIAEIKKFFTRASEQSKGFAVPSLPEREFHPQLKSAGPPKCFPLLFNRYKTRLPKILTLGTTDQL
jgi:hypothetical protein